LAKSFLEQAERGFPNSSAVATSLGAMALALGDEAAARTHLQNAIQLNDRDASAWFQLGLLDRDNAALERATELNPNLGEAHLLLGVRATDDNDLTRALPHLEQAVRLMPRKSDAWYALAFAQVRAKQTAPARESLQQAMHTATTPEQRKMAETLLESLGR
jgi:tetratricopeptide (TPR) repeat protein